MNCSHRRKFNSDKNVGIVRSMEISKHLLCCYWSKVISSLDAKQRLMRFYSRYQEAKVR